MEHRTLGEQLDDHAFDRECDQRLQKAVNEAVEFEREECAKIAQQHGEFCENEARAGGASVLRERAEGAFHIAAKIRCPKRR